VSQGFLLSQVLQKQQAMNNENGNLLFGGS